MGSKQALKSLAMISSGGKIITKIRTYNSPGMNQKKISIQEKKIKSAAHQFVNKLKKQSDHKPSFGFLVWFSVYKALSIESKQHLLADYEFFKSKSYFTDVKLNIFQKFVISFFRGFFRILIKRGLI